MRESLTLLSWNIQNCRGCDNSIQPQRIIDHIRQLAEQPDVICLQEVARFFPEYCCAKYPDQLDFFRQAFPDYHASWAAALSWPGNTSQQRREFGNLTLSRRPLLEQRQHSLPAANPPSSEHWQTPRTALETWIQTDYSSLAIINTHLAFHCDKERRQQLVQLNQLKRQHSQLSSQPPSSGIGIYQQPIRPELMLLCGDLNFTDQSEHYSLMLAAGWIDAAQSGVIQPSCGLYDDQQWPEGPHRRDYCFLSKPAPASVQVDQYSSASDHQSVLLSLELTNA